MRSPNTSQTLNPLNPLVPWSGGDLSTAFKAPTTLGLHHSWVRAAFAFGGGAVAILAFAPFGLFPAALIGPAILFLLWQTDSPNAAARHGWLFGFGLLSVSAYWLHLSPKQMAAISSPLAETLTCLFMATMSLYYALAGILFVHLRQRLGHFAQATLLFPPLWFMAEWTRGWVMGGFPWFISGYSQTDSPLAGWAPLVGVYGLGLAVALSSALLVGWHRLEPRQRTVALGILCLVWGGGQLLRDVDWTQPTGDTLDVTLVQHHFLGDDEDDVVQWQRFSTLTQQALAASDLVVWPEGATDIYAAPLEGPNLAVGEEVLDPNIWGRQTIQWGQDATDFAIPHYIEEQFLTPLEPANPTRSQTVLMGTSLWDHIRDISTNGLLALDGDQRTLYTKRHLVPFGEFIPLNQTLRPFWDWIGIHDSNYSAKDSGTALLPVGDYFAATAICYETAFGHLLLDDLAQAALVVIVGNDSIFDGSLELTQHLQIARMRALETGRWIARSTTTGYSALIDHHGNVVKVAPAGQFALVQGALQPRTGLTPYALGGNDPVLVIALILLGVAQYRRGRP